ncbi:hypothetical protein BH11ACT3_BH11ACT3_19250 [soil metagenome]
MKNRAGRSTLTIVGAAAVLLGAIWIGQGLGFIPGSFMTGDRMWFNIGVIVALVGVIVLGLGLWKPKSR